MPTKLATLLTLHEAAVKAGQRWEAASPGTATKRRLESVFERAQRRFKLALSDATTSPIPVVKPRSPVGTSLQLRLLAEQVVTDQVTWMRTNGRHTEAQLEHYKIGLQQGWSLCVSHANLHNMFR